MQIFVLSIFEFDSSMFSDKFHISRGIIPCLKDLAFYHSLRILIVILMYRVFLLYSSCNIELYRESIIVIPTLMYIVCDFFQGVLV